MGTPQHLGAPCVECRAIYRHFAMCTRGPGGVHADDTADGGAFLPGHTTSPNTPEPPPVANDNPPLWPLVQADFAARHRGIPHALLAQVLNDMVDRDMIGREKYKVPLQAHNGRQPLVDLYQEMLDAVVYARQVIAEAPPSAPGTPGTAPWQVLGLYEELLGSLILIRQLLP